jgi:hypothetical protein
MLAKIRALLDEIIVYLQENPGTAALVGGWAVLVLTKLGLHVTIDQLYAIVAVLIPLLSALHLTARHGRAKRAARILTVRADADQA